MAAKKRIAHALRQAPWLAGILTRVVRLGQSRFTAGVIGVVLNDADQILLVEHVFHPDTPWGLPGGWLEKGELPAACVKREVSEETGVEVAVICPLCIDRGPLRGHLEIAYLCHAKNDVRALSSELLDYRWADINTLPPMKHSHQAAIAALHHRLNNEVQTC